MSIILFLSSFIYLFNLNSNLNEKLVNHSNNGQYNNHDDGFELYLSQSSLSEYSGVGKAQNVTKFGKGDFHEHNLNINNDDNASITVPEYWQAEKITCNISNIYDYDKYWVNSTFDLGFDPKFWTNDTNNPQYVSFGWNFDPISSNDSIYMRFNESDESPDPWKNKYANLNYSFNLPQEQIPYENWEVSYKYRILYNTTDWLIGTGGTSHSLYVYINDTYQEFGQTKLSELNNNTWYDGTVTFQPEQYNLYLPGRISLVFEMFFGNVIIDPPGYLEIDYDNITLKLSTIPMPSQIDLNITDETNGKTTDVNDLGEYGEGTIKLENFWLGDTGGTTHYFTFSHNSSGNVILSSDIYTEAFSYRKTLTDLGVEGSEFIVENNSKTQWTMYFTVTQPGSYSTDYYFNISKPLNWNITEVIDPYRNNKINETIGTGYGNTTFTIPHNIITNGLWKFVAEAPNYVEKADIFRYSNSEWQKNTRFYILDSLKINGTIKTIPDIQNTNVSLKIYYPNETIWYQEVDIPVESNGNYEFSEILINGSSAIAGKYHAQIIWYDFNENMTQVGYSILNFSVIHKTNLTAVNNNFELHTGEPLLLKVKYIDSDFNESIPFGTITYNSTYGTSGIMTYQGLGEYFVDIDTSSLDLGEYYFSFNASKEYYESSYIEDLVLMKIIVQPLELEVPHGFLSATANSYFSCQVNVTGGITGTLVQNTTVNTNWQNPYYVIDHKNGTFTLNFSTYNLPSMGVSEIYTIRISANKINWGETSQTITLTINPIRIQVNPIGFNNTVQGYIGESINIKINLTEVENGIYIENASVFYSWKFRDGFFEYKGTGTYELNLDLSEINEKGGFEMILDINPVETTYEHQTYSIFVVISEKNMPNYIFYVLIIGVLILIGVLSIIGLRSYVILPRRREKESKLLARTQRYKDMNNIEAILVSQRTSGLNLFMESYYALGKYRKELLSGFINAITIMSKEIIKKEDQKQEYSEMGAPKHIESLIELDFKHFYFLIGDYKEVRVIFILKDKASERFKNQLENLLIAIDLQFSEELENWDGSIKKFDMLLPSIIYEYFELYYKGYFKLNDPKHIAKVREETELNTMENRVLNTIYSLSKEKEDFYLRDVIEIVEEKNKNFVIDAIESLIENKIIISAI